MRSSLTASSNNKLDEEHKEGLTISSVSAMTLSFQSKDPLVTIVNVGCSIVTQHRENPSGPEIAETSSKYLEGAYRAPD